MAHLASRLPTVFASSILLFTSRSYGETPQQPPVPHTTPVVKTPPKLLTTVTVNAALDQSRNQLSPSTGSSLYVFSEKAIKALPLGSATALNQVLLQAPGVVQDSFGEIHIRGDHADIQYRINGVMLPESITGFGEALDTSIINTTSLLTGALPAQYGLRTAGVINIQTKSGAALGNGGSVGITGGSYGTLQPHLDLHGHQGKWSWFASMNYLKNDLGISSPTSARRVKHDQTWQTKGFGDLTYLFNDHARISLIVGTTNNRFNIPGNPDQEPGYSLSGVSNYPSIGLTDSQRELTRFAVLSLQGKLGDTGYQVSAGQRYSQVDYTPDLIGDLLYQGVAATIARSNRASTLQADFSTPLGSSNTLRYGIYGEFQRGVQKNSSLVFPADASGQQTSNTPFVVVDNNALIARTASAYIQDQWDATDNLTINGGLRADRVDGYVRESQLSPRLGMVYQVDDQWTVHAGYARYFTPPSAELIDGTDIARFQGTTAVLPIDVNTNVRAMRSHTFDAGVQWQPRDGLLLGLDGYLTKADYLIDEGQFGTALIFSDFNYRRGRNHGVEFTANWRHGPLRAYANLAVDLARAKVIASGQYNFSSAEVAYIQDHWIFLDHAPRMTSSGGASYTFADGTALGVDYLYGSGIHVGFANTDTMPSYIQWNIDVQRRFDLPEVGALDFRLAVINAFDHVYELRNGTGIGVGIAPQYATRRGVFLSVNKDF